MIDPTSSLRKKSRFEETLMALAMSDKINPQTNLGFLPRQVLGGGLNSWAENYNTRGTLKDKEKMGNKDRNLLGSQQDNSALANKINREEVPSPFYQNPLGR